MKSKLICPLIAGALLFSLAACNGNKPTQAPTDLEAIEFSDSSSYEDASVVQTISIAYPASDDNSVLADSLRLFYAEFLRNACEPFRLEEDYPTYNGDLHDGQQLVNFYGSLGYKNMKESTDNQIQEILNDKDLYEDGMGFFMCSMTNNVSFDVEDCNERYTTLAYNHDTYTGGAHGNGTTMSFTFDAQTGRQLGWELLDTIQYHNEIHELVKKGLKSFFFDTEEFESEDSEVVISDEELQEELLVSEIMFPGAPPALTKDGMSFIYQEYEIAAYAWGRPSFTIPYNVIKPYLTKDALRLIGE